MSPGQLSAERRPRRRSPRVAGRRVGAAGRQGVASVAGSRGRSAARRGRADGGRRATASQRATARPAALRSRRALVAAPGPWTSGEGEEALPAWAPAPGRSPKASKPPARGLRVPADFELSACHRTHLRAEEIGAASGSSLLSWVEAPRPPSLQV